MSKKSSPSKPDTSAKAAPAVDDAISDGSGKEPVAETVQENPQPAVSHDAAPANPVRMASTPARKRLSVPKRSWLGKNKKKKLQLLLVVVGVIVLAGFVYSFVQTRNDLKLASDPQAAMQQEAKELAAEVGRYLELPGGETPNVATVKNIEQLRDQSFFERARNGDKVLIYAEAGKAVLYRPDTKKVIEYAPVKLRE